MDKFTQTYLKCIKQINESNNIKRTSKKRLIKEQAEKLSPESLNSGFKFYFITTSIEVELDNVEADIDTAKNYLDNDLWPNFISKYNMNECDYVDHGPNGNLAKRYVVDVADIAELKEILTYNDEIWRGATILDVFGYESEAEDVDLFEMSDEELAQWLLDNQKHSTTPWEISKNAISEKGYAPVYEDSNKWLDSLEQELENELQEA